MHPRLKEQYSFLLESELLAEIEKIGQFRKIRKDFPMINIGQKLTHMPLVLSGAIRVMGEDEKENEILLYYLESGDSCTMTMTCCMGNQKSKIKAIAETEVEIVMIPIEKMEQWITKYSSWRAFVFESYNTRMNELLKAVDSLAFHNLEERLYTYLRERAMVLKSHILDITQYQIANDLNTSRVVISRLLKKLALDGKIEVNRNQLIIKEFAPNII